MKPPISQGQPFRVREFLLAKGVLAEFCDRPLYLRLDKKRMEVEDRPHYLAYLTGCQPVNDTSEELFTSSRLLNFVRDLDMDSMSVDAPKWMETDLAVTLKDKLVAVRLDLPPVIRICSPVSHAGSSLVLSVPAEARLASHSLYIVEVKGRDTRLLCGVTGATGTQVHLSLTHIKRGDWSLVFAFWPIASLQSYILEFQALPAAVTQISSCSGHPHSPCDLQTLLTHIRTCPTPPSNYE